MLNRILLHLAREHGHPKGSSAIGYEILAPLDDDGRLDAGEWLRARHQCQVRRLGSTEQAGLLVHEAGGTGGATWAFDFDPNETDDDERGYRFGSHLFRPGEYVSIADASKTMHTYKVASVEPA